MRKRACAALLAALFSTTQGIAQTHKVKRGETLSEIAADKISRPIYGNAGSLNRIMQMNPEIRDPHSIKVNQVIRLGNDASMSAKALLPVPTAPKQLEAKPVEAAPSRSAFDASSQNKRAGLFECSVKALMSTTEFDVKARDKSFQATPKSKLNKGLDLGLGYNLSDRTKVELQLGLLESSFADSSDGRLKGDDDILKRFGLQVSHRFADRFVVSGSYESEQAYFFARNSLAQFEMENVFIDSLELGLSYDLFIQGSWTWTAGVAAASLLPARSESISPKSGYALDGTTTLSYSVSERLILEGGLGYELRSQDSSYSQQTQEEIGASLGIRLRI